MNTELLQWILGLFLTGLLAHLIARGQRVLIKLALDALSVVILILMCAILLIGASA